MKMKQLLRYTIFQFRAILMFGVFALINIPTQAQTVGLPDAFETTDPANAIGDTENWYYIQFYDLIGVNQYYVTDRSFLSDQGGNGNTARTKDYIPFAKDIQWQLEDAGDEKFYLRSRNGHYIYLENGTYKCGTTKTALSITKRAEQYGTDKAGGGYDIHVGAEATTAMSRQNKNVWANIIDGTHNNHRYPYTRLRIAKLKNNIAHIIYYQTGGDQSNGGATGFGTRHYLTYSGTENTETNNANGWFSQSDVSSRTTPLRTYDSWSIPTAAAYYKDGLWALVESGTEGQFYIKRYGTINYLNPVQKTNPNSFYYSNLGAKDADNGKYVLESPNANRFTRIRNVKYEPEEALTADMFKTWNGYGADAESTGTATVDFNVGNNVQVPSTINNVYNNMVAGTGSVFCKTYADLTDYSKMTISGTENMQLRVLMSRQQSDSGPYVEKYATIGANGKAEVDLTDMTHNVGLASVMTTYVNYNDADHSCYNDITPDNPAKSGFNVISDGEVRFKTPEWGVNNITYLQVDASAFLSNNISKVTLKAKVSGSLDNRRNTTWGVGYNDSQWSTNLTWNNADKSITQVGEEVSTTFSFATGSTQWSTTFLDAEFDITDAFTNDADKIVTLLVYETVAGGGYFKDPVVYVEYANGLNISFVHLNAIKARDGSPSGTISSITLQKESSQNPRYLNHGDGDGWQVFQWEGGHDNDWYAGFLPVEVVQSDDYYQVQAVLNENSTYEIPAESRQNITFTGDNVGRTAQMGYDTSHSGYTRYNPSGEFQRCFQFTNLATNNFQKIIIKFYRPVKGSWHISGIVNGAQGWEKIPEGTTIYEMDLTDISSIDDFCIFNWDANESNPLDIAEIYFYSGYTLGRDGCMTENSEADPILWKLGQESNYSNFRLQTSNGDYVKGVCSMTPIANEAEVYTNLTLWEKFTLKWVYVTPVLKENPVDFYVTHRESYLKQYALQYDNLALDKQGLATEADSEWKNYTGDIGGFTQKVNHFEITHYLKQGDSKVIEFPTVLNRSNDHIYYQRFYNYDETDTQMNLTNLKAHVSLDTTDDGDVQYYLYKNGMVTGQMLDWSSIDSGDFQRNVQRHFTFTNSDGNNFTVAVDVSRYSDMTYANSSNHLNGNLEEPSLTMRYIYYMKDAREMATDLTACTYGGSRWLESKEFHFPAKQIFYENKKKVGYRGEFIGLRHVFSDYWIFDGNNNLVSAVNSNSEGKIEVVISDPNGTGIRLGGWNPTLAAANGGNLKFVDNVSQYDAATEADFKGFYFYDRMSNNNKIQYGDSRFVVFRYPSSGQIADDKVNKPAYINVYFNNNGTRYQLAQFTVIFDENTETLPWKSVTGSFNVVQGSPRDPNQLVTKAGKPIAKITFDYPDGNTYHYPSLGTTRHNGGDNAAGGTIPNSSPVPLTFGKTNYSFDGDNTNWGSYTMVAGKSTVFGKWQKAEPVNHATYGYNISADPGFKSAFLYIDASEQPGDICSAPFVGDFCSGDKLMFSGWISGSNAAGESDNRCPGGITLTVKGEYRVNGELKTETLYRFCPGQCYELDDGIVDGNSFGVAEGDRDKYHVVWQQFYFEFTVSEKYDRHWIEVNNNCVSSQGGDFMLDNIEVYAMVPEVVPGVNTPLCISVDENGNTVTDMRLLKMSVNFNKLKSSANVNDNTTAELGFVFLDKYVFLETFKNQLKTLGNDQKHALGLDDFNFSTITLDELAQAIDQGLLSKITGDNSMYQTAFDTAILGKKKTWHSFQEVTDDYKNSSVMYFQWNSNFDAMPVYSFVDAVNKTSPVYRETIDGERWVVMNGNFPELNWKTNTDYYIIISNTQIDNEHGTTVFKVFNLCSECNKASEFRIEPPLTVLGLEKSGDTHDYMVCEGQIPTLVTELKGFDFNGDEVPMQDINYDWWLGDKANDVLATLDNYHKQKKGDIRLDQALSTLRIYYPDATSLDGIISHLAVSPNPALTSDMVNYLKELVDAGQLVLHQKSISVPAEPAGDEDPYFYLVACPIHDEQFKRALNPNGPASIIKNGTMESYEVNSFLMSSPNTGGAKIEASITGGVGRYGSRGIRITTSVSGNTNVWDSQFFIRANEVIPIGTKFHLEFDYKATAAATVSTQAHSIPGNYIDGVMLGDLNFTTQWQHFERDITVTSAMGGTNDIFQSIAFNLWETQSANDYYFDNVELAVPKNQYVAFFCDEPQGLRVKLGEKAPTLKTGFVPGENTFLTYDYTAANNALLSIRLAKNEQFETVKHGTVADNPEDTYCTTADANIHFLWLPIRNAQTQKTTDGVIRKSQDNNIYLASTNDPVNDKTIYAAMKNGSLPVVGKIVQLNAINTYGGIDSNTGEEIVINSSYQNDVNRLCVYFTENFEVREGYNYTLSLPFQEKGDVNTCDGTILINLKIVPDYEVWTGAAGNTDWNNDENWRRADGNLGKSTEEPKNGAGRNNNELYRTEDLPDESPLKNYVTNYDNYRTAKDRIFRKGFAPLYCTHVLMKSNEWGDAPVLYDALDTESEKTTLKATPFPNLRDYDGWDGTTGNNATKATSTSILRYDMQARHFELWEDTYGVVSNKGRTGDLIAEMYQVNSCAEIAFQPGAEMLNAHLLNYDNAWVEYQLDNKRWYLLGSPLQGTIAGEWYAPKKTAQQKTTYYEPVSFTPRYIKVANPVSTDNPSVRGWYKKDGENYVRATETAINSSTDYYYLYNPPQFDRYNPAIYQRSWDKAKAVLYEIGANYLTTDNPNDLALEDGSLSGSILQGEWGTNGWATTGADRYLDRIGYKPLGDKKVNVAIQGIWSNTYNDATVDYTKGGFSVMVMNHLKGQDGDASGGKAIIRLPKEDTMYDYYEFSQSNADNGGTDTELSDVRMLGRAKNRGRLKTDQFLPTISEGLQTYQKIQRVESAVSVYGDARTYTRVPTRVGEKALPMTLQPFTETVSAGISNLGYYLVENPFPCGLDMDAFFAGNTGLEKKYWLLTSGGQQLVQWATTGWVSPSIEVVTGEAPNTVTTYHFATDDNPTANAVLAPGQGFFVQAKTPGEATTITFNKGMQAQSRYGEPDDGEEFEIVVGTKQVMESVDATWDDDDDPRTPEVPLTIDDDNNPETPEVQVKIDVPKVDNDGNYVVEDITELVTVYKYKQTTNADLNHPLRSRTHGAVASNLPGLVITAQRGTNRSSALVMMYGNASNEFLPEEDTETFITSDLENVPTVYTLCGRLATTINSIHDFRSLSIGVESNSDAPCSLTFQGVEMLGDSIAFYDAVEQKLTPLESGMTISVSGQTQNRYYLVRGLNLKEAAEETHLQIFTEGRKVKVIASTEEPIISVRCFDTGGRMIYSASPERKEYEFSLPGSGVYIIEAQTEKDRKTKKVMTK